MGTEIPIEFSDGTRRRTAPGQAGFTLVELLVVVAILGILAAIVLFNISGVNASAACNVMKTHGEKIQEAADGYRDTYGVYPVGTNVPATLPGVDDATTPAEGATVNQEELVMANQLRSPTVSWNASPAPTGAETFTYKTSPEGTVHGVIGGNSCTYN